MSDHRIELINHYRQKVKSAHKELTKKEAFKDLLNRLYAGEKEIEDIIDKITEGSEFTILNIPRKDRLHRGSADTLYSNIIIEFEKDLKASLKHAEEQLAGYLLGQFKSCEGYNFTLIASDCIAWKVFSPDISQLENLENLTEDELKLNEVASASFTLTENNAEDFYYWLDRFLFREQKQRATLKRIEESFGHQSHVFIESLREMIRHFNDAKVFGEVQVSYQEWRKFLSIAYGAFDDSEKNFLVHTYLSIFSKMLAYSLVSNDDCIDDEELKGIISGSIFNRYNIRNFVENDFFHWINSERNFRGLRKVFRVIAQEIFSYHFNEVDEDILKGVYQELIDLDTRHSLGEYYTPDWLCERIVSEFQFKAGDKILDPACGSGSFLRAAVHRIRELNPETTVGEISGSIYGIDIHPLSVQIAKTTVLLALGKEVAEVRKPIHINIILANTLLAPEGVENLFGKETFDYVIGNPPWFTYSSVRNEEYQNLLNDLAGEYKVKPLRAANFPNLEIAAIFMSHCSSFFLNENGKISFVLPRSFFSADHHDNTRSGKAKGFRLTQIWDLEDVSPLFRIPSSVFFAEKADNSADNSKINSLIIQAYRNGIKGIVFSGKLPGHNCNLKAAESKLEEETSKWYYIQQGKSSAFSTRKIKSQNKTNYYRNLFKRGSTIIPRALYFIQLTQEPPRDWNDRIISIKTSEDIQADAKAPWKGLDFSGTIESNFIFRTALSKSILPFALYKPDWVVLPVTVEPDSSNKKEIKLHSAKELLQEGYRDAAKWFLNAEKIWDLQKTEKSKNMTSNDRLDFQKGLTGQNLNAPYLVLYNASAKDANAAIVKRKELDLEFVVESKGYFFATENLKEAYYLTAIMNAATPNLMMKDFQTKGLFGARDVSRKILDIYYPKFDETDEIHLQLAALSKEAHHSVSDFLKEQLDPAQKIEGIRLGKIRMEIKTHLSKEMKAIDNLVKQLIG